MTDNAPQAEVVRLEASQPWYARPAGTVFLILLGVSLLLFAGGSWVDRNTKNDQLNEVRTKLETFNAQNTAETVCRSGRSNDLLIIASQLAGDTAKLFVVLAQRATIEQMQPIIDRLGELATQRDAAEGRLKTAPEDCRPR